MRLPRSLLLGAVTGIALALPAQLPAQTDIELEGTISGVQGTTIELFHGIVRFEAGGARIETNDENFTNISDLPAGTAIEVRATATTDGSIQASRVEVSDEKEDDAEVGGVIGTVDPDAQTFTIGPISIAWNGQTKLKDISRPVAGQSVEVTVQVSGERLVALAIEREEADD